MISSAGLTPLIALIAAHAPPQPAGIPVRVDAPPGVSYAAKCHIRSFKDPLNQLKNTYTINTKGPFSDRIPSPNAQCLLVKLHGEGPVTLHVIKAGDHTATTDRIGEWVRLNVW